MNFLLLKQIYACCIVTVILKVECLKPQVFKCNSDWCNVNSEHQYCSDKFKYCRNCEEVKDDCRSYSQPLNCTGYCIGIAVKEALENRDKEETSCSVVPMMLNIPYGTVNGSSLNATKITVWSNLTYSCNKGYTLQGSGTITCTGNGKWSQSELPYCLDNSYFYKGDKRATINLAIVCAVCIIGYIMVIVYFKWKKRQGGLSRQSTDNSIKDEEAPFIEYINTDKCKKDTAQVPNGTTVVRHADNMHCLEDTENSFQSPTSATLPTGSNLEDSDQEHNKANCPVQEPAVAKIVNIFYKNEGPILQQRSLDSTQRLPEARIQNNKNLAKIERPDEKLPTEESKVNLCDETTDEKRNKGTKPLPGRNEAKKPMQETLKKKGSKGPEAVPAEDDDIGASTSYETSQGQISKNFGFQDVTFSKNDITDKRREVMNQEEASQEMLEMKRVEDKD